MFHFIVLQITKDGNVVSSIAYVRELVYDWMLQAATFEVFGAVVTVTQCVAFSVLEVLQLSLETDCCFAF